MFFEILLAILIGTSFGTITGLIPGLHVNLISILLLTLSPLLLNFTSPIILVIIIISMALTHTFLDSLPSIFLGAPDSSTALAVLPGHKMLLEGRGYEAVMLTVIGSLSSLILAVSLMPAIGFIIPKIYPTLKTYIPYFLILISSALILREKTSKYWAFFTFILAGTLGITTLNFPNLTQPLFPLFSGLFGTSTLLLSLKNYTKIPSQKITRVLLNKKESYKAISTAVGIGSIASILPGLGPSQAAIIGTQISRRLTNRGFMVLVGGLNTVNIIISFVTLYTINKARNGAIVTASQILEALTIQHLILLIGATLVVGGIATFLTVKLTKVFSKIISKVNYKFLTNTIVVFISTLVLIISGPIGFVILISGTAIGIIPPLKHIGKNHLMGALLIPIILFFLL